MISVDIKIDGLKQLEDELKQFPEELQKKAIGTMVASGARMVKDDAVRNFRSLAKVQTGESTKSIVMRRLKRKSSDRAGKTLTYGVLAKFPAHFMETGTKPHTISAKDAKALGKDASFGRTVHHPGTPARPFLRPALDRNGEAVVTRMGYKLMAWLDRQYKKGILRVGK